MASLMVEQFVVGIVRGTHGITGEFKVESTSGEYAHFADMEEVTLTDGTDSKVFRVEYTQEASATLYMKLEGISTPEAAAKFNRWQIVVPRKYAHQLQEGEWYIEDLKGCSVWYKEATTDNTVGTVTDVKEGGSGYLVEILLSESCKLLSKDVMYSKSGNVRTVFVPFVDQFINKAGIDVKNKKMQLMHLWILE